MNLMLDCKLHEDASLFVSVICYFTFNFAAGLRAATLLINLLRSSPMICRGTTLFSNFPYLLTDPEPANVTWFRSMDLDNTGRLSLQELTYQHQFQNWFNRRFTTAMDRLISEADLNNDRVIDMAEYLK